MNSKIQEMIQMALEDGVITENEKKIILKKAVELGEDTDMVDLAIEGALGDKKRETERKQAKGMKCPKCGGAIPSGQVICPDCGFLLAKNEANHTALDLQNDLLRIDREIIEQLGGSVVSRFFGALTNAKENGIERKMTRITTTVIPNTRADLLELLAFTAPKADKAAPKNGVTSSHEENLGYGYWTLFSNCVLMAKHNFENDPNFIQYFELYNKKAKKRGVSKGAVTTLVVIASIAIILLCYAPFFFSDRNDKKVLNTVEICVQNHDYQGAKAAAKKYSGDEQKLIDEISAQEVSYLISIGNVQQAKVVAASIDNQEKRESILSAINDATPEAKE